MTRILPSNAGPMHDDAAAHIFKVGQAVRLKRAPGTPNSSMDIHYITAVLPPRGNSPQYRIRNDDERHERVATQDSLEQVSTSQPGSGTTLIERTFGYGQRTETQQSRDQEAEEGKGTSKN